MTADLDANGVIDLVEMNPTWGPEVLKRVADLRKLGCRIATSDLAQTKCLAQPFRAGDAAVIADFQNFFDDPNVAVLPLTAAVYEKAAQLRAASLFRLKIPDCLHLATSIEHGCGLFLTTFQPTFQLPAFQSPLTDPQRPDMFVTRRFLIS